MRCIVLAQAVRQEERVNSSFAHVLFCLGPHQIGWCPPTVESTVYFTGPPVQMLISPGDRLTDTPRYNVFNLDTQWPVKLTHKINHHRFQARK